MTGGAREYADAERRRVLADFADLCSSLADELRRHGEPWAASGFEERAALARDLLADGWDQRSLSEVGAPLPGGLVWLNPRAVDSGVRREPWQEDFAVRYAQAARLAVDVRAVATYD